MTNEQIANVAVEIINLLATKKCTVAEANEILDCTKQGITSSTTVQKLNY